MPLALVFTLMSCTADESYPTEESTSITKAQEVVNYDYNADETTLAAIINDYRVSKGLKSLQIVNEYMISKKVVNHDLFPERSENIIAVLGAVRVNENIAYNFTTPNSALHAWLKSPAHKANIEGDFTHFGISISIDSETGERYFTNIFMKK